MLGLTGWVGFGAVKLYIKTEEGWKATRGVGYTHGSTSSGFQYLILNITQIIIFKNIAFIFSHIKSLILISILN